MPHGLEIYYVSWNDTLPCLSRQLSPKIQANLIITRGRRVRDQGVIESDDLTFTEHKAAVIVSARDAGLLISGKKHVVSYGFFFSPIRTFTIPIRSTFSVTVFFPVRSFTIQFRILLYVDIILQEKRSSWTRKCLEVVRINFNKDLNFWTVPEFLDQYYVERRHKR